MKDRFTTREAQREKKKTASRRAGNRRDINHDTAISLNPTPTGKVGRREEIVISSRLFDT